MTTEGPRWWFGLTTVERDRSSRRSALPGWARGACVWIAAFAVDGGSAQAMIEREVERRGDTPYEVVLDGTERAVRVDPNLGQAVANADPDLSSLVWGVLSPYD